MAAIKTFYPSTNTVVLSITPAALASDNNLLAGKLSVAVDNTSNLDLDHLVGGVVTTGTNPTGGQIEIWAYAPRKIVSGVATYPDNISSLDSYKSMTSLNVKYNALRLIASMSVDTSSDRRYDFAPVSVSSLFGNMPLFWGLFIVHNTGVALNATAANHEFHYTRVQGQV